MAELKTKTWLSNEILLFARGWPLIQKSIVILILLSLLSTGTRVFAQQQNANDPKDVFEMSLEELMEVEVYTASKYKQKVSEAPSSVTIITADDIKKYGYRTLADILRSARGFYTTYDRNYTYLGVRGFGRPGDYNGRILFLIDGHRINDSIYGSIMVGNTFYLDVDNIERIEIVRGPGSSLYGNNAFFAVINVITKNGGDLDGVEVSGQMASYGTFKEQISYGKKFDEDKEIFLSYSNSNSKGQKLYFKDFDDPSTNNGTAKDCDKEDYYNLFGKILLGEFTLEGAYVTRNKRVPTAPWGAVFNDKRTKTHDQMGFLD